MPSVRSEIVSEYYSIFGKINYFSDREGIKRGQRKRDCDTRIFVIEGTLKIVVENAEHLVSGETEFTVQSGRWHWLEAWTDVKYLQLIDSYSHAKDEKKPIEDTDFRSDEA